MVLRVEDKLDQAGAVSEIGEDQAAVVAAPVKPALEPHTLPDV